MLNEAMFIGTLKGTPYFSKASGENKRDTYWMEFRVPTWNEHLIYLKFICSFSKLFDTIKSLKDGDMVFIKSNVRLLPYSRDVKVLSPVFDIFELKKVTAPSNEAEKVTEVLAEKVGW